jgi:hypothetical protein
MADEKFNDQEALRTRNKFLSRARGVSDAVVRSMSYERDVLRSDADARRNLDGIRAMLSDAYRSLGSLLSDIENQLRQ